MLSGFLTSMKIEFRKMLRDRMIIIVVFIIPIFVNILVGFVLYKNQIQNIPMAIVDEDNSSLSRMITEQFRENEMFNVKYDLNSQEELEKLINSSKIRVGMIIPKNFEKDVYEIKSPTLLMVYDGSHMSIASSAKSRASEILLTLKTGTLIKLIEAKLGLSANDAYKTALGISFTSRTLYNPTKSFRFFLLPGFGMAIIQTAIALMGAVAIRSSELEKGVIKRLGYLLGKTIFYTIIGSTSVVLCLLLQLWIFDVPLRGSFLDILLLAIPFMAAVSAISIFISSWVRNEMISTIINAVLFIPSTIMIGYTWPVMSMPDAYKTAAAFHPFYHFADNLRDLLLKGSTSGPISNDILWFLTAILVFTFLSFVGVAKIRSEEVEYGKTNLEENFKDSINETAN